MKWLRTQPHVDRLRNQALPWFIELPEVNSLSSLSLSLSLTLTLSTYLSIIGNLQHTGADCFRCAFLNFCFFSLIYLSISILFYHILSSALWLTGTKDKREEIILKNDNDRKENLKDFSFQCPQIFSYQYQYPSQDPEVFCLFLTLLCINFGTVREFNYNNALNEKERKEEGRQCTWTITTIQKCLKT